MVLNVQEPYPVVPACTAPHKLLSQVTSHVNLTDGANLIYFCVAVYRVELDSYSVSTRCCTSRGSSGKLLRPAHMTLLAPQPVHPVTGQDCAADTCKAANSTPRRSSSTSTCRFTIRLYPGGQTQYQWYKDRACDWTTVEIASRLT